MQYVLVLINDESEVFMNKVVIVTGGSKGIGFDIVNTLARNSYTVVFTYNTSEENALLLKNKFDNVFPFRIDFQSESDISSLVDFAVNKFGKVDLLINNVGVDLVKQIQDISNDDFDRVINVNLKTAFILSRGVSKNMIKNHRGNIINISSIWGIVGASMESVYSISKAGIDGLTKSLAKELGPSNIRVNSIAPGFIDTNMNSFLSANEKQKIIDEIPLGRIGKPSDISNVVMMLENCDYITGQIIQVNGGWNI